MTVPAHPRLWSTHDELNRHFRRYTRASLAAAAGDGVEDHVPGARVEPPDVLRVAVGDERDVRDPADVQHDERRVVREEHVVRERRERGALPAGRLICCNGSKEPNYIEAIQALRRILQYPLVGIDHPGRAFIAYTVFLRYGEPPNAKEAMEAAALLSERWRQRAILLGAALRLSYRVSAATRWVLEHSALRVDGKMLELRLPDDGSVPEGEAADLAAHAATGRVAVVFRRPDGRVGLIEPED